MYTLIHSMPGDAIAGSGYHGIVLDRLAKQAAEILAVDESCIFVRDHADPDMAIVAAAHGADEAIVGKRVPIGLEHSRARQGALVQLSWEGDVQGALSVGSAASKPPSSSNRALLETLAPAVAAAIWHAHVRPDTDPSLRSQIATLSAALDERDGYTGRHSHQAMCSARTMGSHMGLDAAGLAELEVAALLHDIGKLLVPDSILNKPGPLTPAEHAQMAEHPALGAQILARIPGLEAVAAIVRYHHERWDGAGYPDGLSGTCIPLASRIIAVCDSYNAMTSDRPYRRALSHRDALAELRAHAGWQFDPDVAFCAEEMFQREVAA
jgi:HD-GYP domain-containing protein (c-di-GMP phosphodiesterase class II)